MQTSEEKAFAILRQIRNAYLSDIDPEVMKYISLGQSVPDDIANYLQELRDIPQTVTPTLLDDGTLDETTFSWPIPPLWWWIKKGFDNREIIE
jgi:hypothetical protein